VNGELAAYLRRAHARHLTWRTLRPILLSAASRQRLASADEPTRVTSRVFRFWGGEVVWGVRALKALPGVEFELCEWKYQVRVGSDHHVEHERCFYSVPFQFMGQRVDLRFTATMVEIFLSNRRVALHARLQEAGSSSTLPEHRPIAHERVLRLSFELGGSCRQPYRIAGPSVHGADSVST